MEQKKVIEARGISKSFGELEVLKTVDFSLPKDKIVSIVGASGAGKTTLLQILGTLEKPDQGDLFIEGQSLVGMSDHQISSMRNQKIGFVFQFHHLLPEFNALENICIPGYIGNGNPAEVEEKAKSLLETMGVYDRRNNKPSELSGGEQQRIAIARAMINNPAVVLADEPTGNLDSTNARVIHDLFLQMKSEYNQAFVLVTHNQELAQLADIKLEMKDGNFL